VKIFLQTDEKNLVLQPSYFIFREVLVPIVFREWIELPKLIKVKMPRHSDKTSLLGSAWQSAGERNVVVLMNGVRRTGGTNIVIQRCFLKQVTVKRCVAGLLVLSLLSILYYTHYLSSPFAR
jgi:hypothetical protein